MIVKNQIYKCAICGNVVEVVHAGGGMLVCCGQDMNEQKENIIDASLEKHVPVVEKTDDGVLVKVGSVAHPMEEAHYIEWIEILTESGKVFRQDLKPGMAPEAVFCIAESVIIARAYCNLHGLWKS